MRVSNPQIINGQQTTRTLHSADGRNTAAAVLVKAIVVPRDPSKGSEQFDSLVSSIVAATNWQNAIRPSDLMANDRRQIEIEREFRKFNCYYLRKRQSRSEARRFTSANQKLIAKEEIAQAVAACELDPAIVRHGKEGLFEEHLYGKVFPTSDALFYLVRYRLMREVGYVSKGYPERAYAKWLVLNWMWSQLSLLVRSRTTAMMVKEYSEKGTAAVVRPLSFAIDTIFRASLAFFRRKRGQGERAVDVSSFFQKKGLREEFDAFLRSSGRSFVPGFRRRWQSFERGLSASDAVPLTGKPKAKAASA